MSGTAAVTPRFTSRADELSLELLQAVLDTRHPGVTIAGFDLLESRQYGEQMVSTSGRAILTTVNALFTLDWDVRGLPLVG